MLGDRMLELLTGLLVHYPDLPVGVDLVLRRALSYEHMLVVQ